MKKLFFTFILLNLFISPEIVVAGGGHDHDEGEHHEENEPLKGPNGGRLLKEGDFAFNLTARPSMKNLSQLSVLFVIPPIGFDEADQP